MMLDITDGKNLPGYKKKSFVLHYNGGEIWFEHLDGIYGYENLVLEKLANDTHEFLRPSSTSFICFVFDETTVTNAIINAVENSVCKSGKQFLKVAFTGIDRRNANKIKKRLSGNGFAVGFLDGLEYAKEWLLSCEYDNY